MKFKRIISTVLAVLMLISAFTIAMSAEETADGTVEATEKKTDSSRPTIDYFTGQSLKEVKNEKKEITYEPTGEMVIFTAEDKLNYMDLRFEKDGYQLYVDEYSGEVATRCIATGEILFSNPYTIGNSSATAESIKPQLLSQLAVKYIDISTGDENTYYSYEWASQRNQINVRNIKNGIRVEYTIGREEARMLVPRLIEKSAFETKIVNIMAAAVGDDVEGNFLLNKLKSYYSLQDPSSQSSSKVVENMYKTFPITKKMPVYALDNSTSQTEMATIEQYIKTYCPDYTYEELDEDHMLTEYESEDKNPPLFKMALEYTLDELGMTVRLPANGIRFNESLYQLYSIDILPYMGAGANSNTAKNFSEYNSGYTFFPDGSGALFDFEKIADLGAAFSASGKVYGQDYAYHTISGENRQVIRYPVFGVTETEDLTALENLTAVTEGKKTKVVADTDALAIERQYKDRGYVAIVEEGDALMELKVDHAVRTNEYNTVRMTVYPRPQDTYNVADSISVGSNDTWTVVSARKYTGNYKIRYIMLTDSDVAEAKGVSDYYDCTYVGMARAYREYLEKQEILTRLDEESVGEDVPLYIEAFGALQTTERFLSIPMDVLTPLTTFEDVKTMYDDLAEEGIENINFVLKGFAKGGLTKRQTPYNLKWNKAVKGEMDFDELLSYAKDKEFGLYPDFDFAYVMGDGMFDGLSLKKHAVKTIDDRYTSKREYSATKQTYVSYFELAISPAYYNHFYTHFTEEYLEYDPMGISVSTLGSALNSDFDEDEPYNREDSKNYTVNAFEHFDENYDRIITSGGNAYTWKYVDYITDIALDSSRYSKSSASVPFLGMVLHGYVEIAGTPINMEGNVDYAMLKAIENGASLKFILSYRNTNNLKNYEDLSRYYSIRYDIWFEDVVELYNEINDALAGVQTSVITDHRFVKGVRVPDSDELLADAATAVEKALENEAAYRDAVTQAEKDKYRNARQEIKRIIESISKEIDETNLSSTYITVSDGFNACYNKYDNTSSAVGALKDLIDEYIGYGNIADLEDKQLAAATALANAKTALDNAKTALEANPDDETLQTAVETAQAAYDAAELEDIKCNGGRLGKVASDKTAYDEAKTAFKELLVTAIADYTALTKAAETLMDLIVEMAREYELVIGKYSEDVKNSTLTDAQKAVIKASVDNFKTKVEAFVTAGGYDDITDMDAAVEAMNTKLKTYFDDYTVQLGRVIGGLDTVFASADFDVLPEEYAYEIEPEEETDTTIKYEKVEVTTYSSDDNKIVYEEYENGTSFLLNFNNYKVKVTLDGEIYTLEAYGYIVLSRGN